MYKFVLVVLALVAVASAQYIASPYAYSGLYRSSLYSGYGYPAVPTTYSAGAYAPYGYSGLLYK